jgi:hypothetical protein
MNINNQLFKAITDNLNTVLDTVPAHSKIETREYEYYSMDVAFSSLMSYYTCRDNNQKEPKKLLSFVFNCGVIIRNLCDAEKDFEKRQSLVCDFLEHCDLWNDGWFDRLLTNEGDRKNVEISRELAIEETTYLTYQKYGIEIEDNGKLQDMITVLVAIFMFASRIEVDFCRNTAMAEG